MNHFSTVLLLATLAAPAAAQWSFAPTTAQPGAEMEPLLAYNVLTAETLLVTGYNGPDRQMWTYDGQAWTQLSPPTMATQRRGANMALDFTNNRLVLFGGQGGSSTSGTTSGETWIWDGTTWSGTTPCPVGRARHGMVFDAARSRVVVYGGTVNVWSSTWSADTWEFDYQTQSWSNPVVGSGPGERGYPAMCYSLTLQRTVLFGGDRTNGADDETWLYDGQQWTQVPVTGPRPPVRTRAQMVYEGQRGICVLFGGEDPTTGAILNDTWEFDGTSWRDVGQGIAPARKQFGMTYDYGRSRPVLFGGRLNGGALRNDTWEYAATQLRYGSGCSGTWGIPSLDRGTDPEIGGTASATLSNLDPAATLAFVALGQSRTSWQLGSLPSSLQPFGMPGCVVYASPDLFQVVVANGGSAAWQWQVPNDTALFGLQYFMQGLSIDPQRNAAGLTVSNALQATIGW